MTVSLVKGQNISLTKEAADSGNATLTSVTAGLGWDVRTTDGAQFDLDVSAFVLDANGKVLSDKHFVFFGNKATPNGAVKVSDDNVTGAGDGDDETLTVDFTTIEAEAEKIVIAVTIYEADQRAQNFGQVPKSYIRIVDNAGTELAKFDLGEDFSLETAVTFAEIYRNGADWKVKAIGAGYSSGLAGLCGDYGVSV